jgi:hypothetical protein
MKRTLLFVLSLAAGDGLEAAREAFLRGQFQVAIKLAEPHLNDAPDQAWKLIGGSYCFLKDQAGAQKAWANLDETGRSFLKYVCKRNGISLP